MTPTPSCVQELARDLTELYVNVRNAYLLDPLDAILREQVKTAVNTRLLELSSVKDSFIDAFQVICDETNNTPRMVQQNTFPEVKVWIQGKPHHQLMRDFFKAEHAAYCSQPDLGLGRPAATAMFTIDLNAESVIPEQESK